MDGPITVKIKRLATAEGLALPARMTAEAAGFDLAAAIASPVVMPPGAIQLIPCGFAMAIPPGYEGQVRPRSGMASRYGITLVNSPGTIDADYRGEVQVLLVNLGAEPFAIRRGMRIAQLVIAPVAHAELREAAALEDTGRAGGGFGSTGL